MARAGAALPRCRAAAAGHAQVGSIHSEAPDPGTGRPRLPATRRRPSIGAPVGHVVSGHAFGTASAPGGHEPAGP